MSPPRRRSIFADRLAAHASFAMTDDAVFAQARRWRDFFDARTGVSDGERKIVLELGSAEGSLLCAMAAEYPSVGFIGLDWKAKQTFLAAERVSSAALTNVALLLGRAQDLTRIFGKTEVDHLLVFFPEPCDRLEELPNRLLSVPFLNQVHRVLKDERSTLALKTDHAGYFAWMLAQLGQPQPDWKEMVGRSLHRDLATQPSLPSPDHLLSDRFRITKVSLDFWSEADALALSDRQPFARHRTPFEERFLRRKQRIFYLELQKRSAGGD